MNLRLVIMGCVAPAAIGVVALPALAQMPPHSAAMERAIVGEMNSATRGAVKKRATGGNTVSGVIATILLNNYQLAREGKAGEAVSVVAIDFVRGMVVIKDAETFEPVRFDPKTLNILS